MPAIIQGEQVIVLIDCPYNEGLGDDYLKTVKVDVDFGNIVIQRNRIYYIDYKH